MYIFIMQPTFLPWIGYFDMIDQCKDLVFLNDVDYTKNSWQNRNKIKTKKGLEWVTLPVSKNSNQKKLSQKKIISNDLNFKKIKDSIYFSYNNSQFFGKYSKEFFDILEDKFYQSNLCNLNIELIMWVMKILKIKKNIYFSDKLKSSGKRTKKIVNICNELNNKYYLSTIGSIDYINKDQNLIKESNIRLFFHNYEHPKYKQIFGDFLPYASVIDLIFNEGENSMNIVKSGRKKLERFL